MGRLYLEVVTPEKVLVNQEVDVIAKYVEQFIRARGQGVTAEFLREHGYSVS